MSKLLYAIGNQSYILAIKIASLWNAKASQWVKGRKNWEVNLNTFCQKNKNPIIWMHCASLGEFEQGRPLIEEVKKNYSNYSILISFFSPSGYEIQNKNSLADYVCYLPINSQKNASTFIKTVSPTLVLWVKYDYWDAYLKTLANNKIPILLFSAKFRKEQPFFRWYGSYWKQLLTYFKQIFVQDYTSIELLQKIKIDQVSIAGDTRFDRVMAISKEPFTDSIIENFIGNNVCIVAGSTWSEDDEELCHFANNRKEIKFIIAPHHINTERLSEIEKLYHSTIRYSNYIENTNANVLIIDNIGLLAYLYRYAKICIIGGGFGGGGVHNTLEAAVYGKPLIFGPEFEKYQEAVDLINLYVAFDVDSAIEMEEIITDLLEDEDYYNEKVAIAKKYVLDNVGSSKKIIDYIQINRLLTKV